MVGPLLFLSKGGKLYADFKTERLRKGYCPARNG